MDARSMWLPGQINLAQGHQSRKFYRLVSSRTEKNIAKYYPDTAETQKGHMNQTQKNVRSTKCPRHEFKVANIFSLGGKKERNIFTSVYKVCETIFSDQTGQFPTRSQHGNKYIMVMVEVDSNAILLKPMKS
jgi:hypothetical protein